MKVASSRPDHLPTQSAARSSELYLLVKSPFGGGAADAGNATSTFFFCVPAISKLTILTVESLWTAPIETAKHHILAIDEARYQQQFRQIHVDFCNANSAFQLCV